ncbi:ferritin family protein [Tannockella kyphosi]|uniref:hypothetical protein n=1 Tax=Tannockella kyphosi TaxID=2899121 RepID=UPI0020122E8C|nr:hypothetical protein [Tannockella kyphosi]
MNYKINSPYPCVHLLNKNREDGEALLKLLAGIYSKASVFHLYTYHYCVFEGSLKDTFFYIKAIKNNHLELLMDCVYQYGIEPRLWTIDNDHIDYWNPFYCQYHIDPICALKNSILLEIQIIEYTTTLIHTIKDKSVIHLLERIKQEDLIHLDLLSNLHETYVTCLLTQ